MGRGFGGHGSERQFEAWARKGRECRLELPLAPMGSPAWPRAVREIDRHQPFRATRSGCFTKAMREVESSVQTTRHRLVRVRQPCGRIMSTWQSLPPANPAGPTFGRGGPVALPRLFQMAKPALPP